MPFAAGDAVRKSVGRLLVSSRQDAGRLLAVGSPSVSGLSMDLCMASRRLSINPRPESF